MPSAWAVNDGDAYTVYLVRHAEKSPTGDDPELSELGRSRALALARMLSDAGIQAVWSSDFARTRLTAQPLADQRRLTTRLYDPHDLSAVARTLVTAGQTALVVGHSNTTPELVQLLGGDPHGTIDDDTEFDRLYVLTLRGDQVVSTVLLRYSAK